VFVDEFMYWVDKYGMKDWEIVFSLTNTAEHDYNKVRADIGVDHEGKIAVVRLDKEWDGMDPSEHNLKRCAYHEATELLISKFVDICRSRTVTVAEIEEQSHRIIRILENVQFEPDYKTRKRKKNK